MIIGTVKEIKNNENRVGLTPAGVDTLHKLGHTIYIEEDAGIGSGFSNADYEQVGATILSNKKELFDKSDMIVKVKEPLESEYSLFHENQILFTYLHLAAEQKLTKSLLDSKVIGIAYETITGKGSSLPLLAPMSEVAGRMSIQVGSQFLEKPKGGKGILLGGVPGVEPALVVIVGGGVVGTNATKMAVGMGATVVVIDKSIERLAYLDDIFGNKITTIMSNSYNITQWVKRADLLVSSILIPGAKAPKIITEEMVKTMKLGSVIVDVAIDQGGSVETIDHITTHSDPVYCKHGVVHYSVANMPGAVPKTSTLALTNVTLDYILQIANKGWINASKNNIHLARGVNTAAGKLTNKAVADSLNLEYSDLNSIVN